MQVRSVVFSGELSPANMSEHPSGTGMAMVESEADPCDKVARWTLSSWRLGLRRLA